MMNMRETIRAAGDLDDFFENGAVPLHIVGPDGTILRANRAELDLLGYRPDEYVGRSIKNFHADDATINDILTRLSSGEKIERYPARLRAKDGSIRQVEITSSVQFDEQGCFLNTRCFSFDVTALRKVEDTVRQQQDNMRQVLSALPAAVYMTDKDGIVTYFNKAAEELAGRTPQIGKDQWCVSWRLHHLDGTPLAHDECPMAIAIKEKRAVRGAQAFIERPDGTMVPFAPYPTPLFDGKGELVGAINMLLDITERKEYEAHIALVMRELSHRSKNLFTVIQSFAMQLMKFCASFPEFQEKFITRLHAMARVHDLLVVNDWAGVDMRKVIEGEVGAFLENAGKRVEFSGGEIMLNPSSAQNLSIAVHELATNAVKYGALAHDGGVIEVAWQSNADDAISFSWRERQDSTIEQPGSRGFGSHMLSILFQDSKFDFNPNGLHFSGLLTYSQAQPDKSSRWEGQRTVTF